MITFVSAFAVDLFVIFVLYKCICIIELICGTVCVIII